MHHQIVVIAIAGIASVSSLRNAIGVPPSARVRTESSPLSGRKTRRHTSRSEEHTSELQSLMRISYAVFCLKKKINESKLRTQHKLQSTIIIHTLSTIQTTMPTT